MLILLAIPPSAAEEAPTRTVEAISEMSLSTIGVESTASTTGTVDTTEVPALYTEHITTSPAASLLSADASEIQRPGTPGDLVVVLGEGFNSRSVSVEAAPFWLAASPGLSLTEHLSGGAPTLWRNAAISMAVSEGDADADGAMPVDLATGLRLTWWPTPGLSSPQGVFLDALERGTMPEDAPEASACLSLLSALVGLASDYSARRETLLSDSPHLDTQVGLQVQLRAVRTELETTDDRERLRELRPIEDDLTARIAAIDVTLAEEAEALWETVVAEWEQGSADDRATCAAVIQAREGLSVDLAGGAAMTSSDSSVSGMRLSGFTGWVAPAWVFADQKTSLVGLIRLAGTDWIEAGSMTLDSGARLIHAWQRYAVSAEGGYRAPLVNASSSVWTAAGLDIRVQEGVWLTGSIGVRTPFDAPASLLSGLNLTIDFSADRTIVPSATPSIPDIN
ncbi:MAG: hypothetical protein ACI8RZ_003757 [Myxococcota bacterium]|jgi:hypothetical protein